MIFYTVRPGDDPAGWPARAAADVAEGFCPYCKVELISAGRRGVCPCPGCASGWSLWQSPAGIELRQDGVPLCEHSPLVALRAELLERGWRPGAGIPGLGLPT